MFVWNRSPVWAFMVLIVGSVAQALVCEQFESYRDVLNCVVESSPEVEQAKLFVVQNRNLVGVAKQRPNPELASKILAGKTGNDSYQYGEFNFAHTFELGGKRAARIARSEAIVRSDETDLRRTQEKIYVKTYLALVRLRQISTELEIYDDALATFQRVQKQYRSRPRMTPEQQATNIILDIAASNYALRRLPLVKEAKELDHFIEHSTGKQIVLAKGLLPPLHNKWPTLSVSKSENISFELKKKLEELEVEKAGLESAKSLAWPDLKFGPTLETQSQGNLNTNALGINFSLPLPLYQTNGFGRSLAAAAILRAENLVSATRLLEEHELMLNREKYQDAVVGLAKAMSLDDLHRRHKAIERSFAQGVVASSLILEVHRQMADYIKSLSEQENTAIESLAQVYAIEGRLLTEGL